MTTVFRRKGEDLGNEKGQKVHTTHIWQEYLDLVEQIRKTDRAKEIYAQRKEAIERVFADAKERHAMRYTHHRGLAAVTRWVRFKFAAMNLKKLAVWSWKNSIFAFIITYFCPNYEKTPAFMTESGGLLYSAGRPLGAANTVRGLSISA